MKKIIFLLALSIGIVSCEKEEEFETIEQTIDTEIPIEKEIFSFENWDEFREQYLKFAELETDELQTESFFTFDREMDVSYALQGILNKDYQFILGGKTILFEEGTFYELKNNTEKSVDKSNLKEIGSVSQTPVAFSDDGSINKTVVIGNQREFRKQTYTHDCGAGRTEGTSPRTFKFVHEAYAETINGSINSTVVYALYLKVKLEYNHKRNKWRHSGEKRVISINITNNSFVTDHRGTNYSLFAGPAAVTKDIWISAPCSSDRQILISSLTRAGEIRLARWNVNVSGTITQQMLGDVSANRWRDQVSW